MEKTSKSQKNHRTPALVLVLDSLRSGHNVGAAFRLADAFGIDALYLCGHTPKPPHREIRKTALGAEANVPWQAFRSVSDALTRLRKEGYRCVALEQTPKAVPLQACTIEERRISTALIFGHEVWGLSEEALHIADACFEIPQHGQKKSLNVSTCIAIAVWVWTQSPS